MFGSLIVDELLYELLSTNPAITDVVGDSIYPLRGAPQGATYPVLLFYMEQSAYDGNEVATNAEYVTGEVLRYVVRISTEGSSVEAIAPAAIAQFQALAGAVIDTPDGDQVTFVAQGEFPMTSSIDGSQVYRHLGTNYGVTITNGG